MGRLGASRSTDLHVFPSIPPPPHQHKVAASATTDDGGTPHGGLLIVVGSLTIQDKAFPSRC